MNSELFLTNVHYSNKAFNRICICCFRYFIQTNIVYFSTKNFFFFCFLYSFLIFRVILLDASGIILPAFVAKFRTQDCAHIYFFRASTLNNLFIFLILIVARSFSQIITHFSHSNVRIYSFSPFFDFISF